MLIVVVIIGILAWAILPRLSWVIARSRDTQRIADLRNIGTAVTMYAERRWVYPELDCDIDSPFCTLRWSASRLWSKLSQYLSSVPKDPQNQMIEIHFQYQDHKINPNGRVPRWRGKWGRSLVPWEYVYQLVNNGSRMKWWAILVAKMETPDLANYVLAKPTYPNRYLPGIWWGLDTIVTLAWGVPIDAPFDNMPQIYFCSEINKWSEAKREKNAEWKYICTYTSEDQLYYIYKIE